MGLAATLTPTQNGLLLLFLGKKEKEGWRGEGREKGAEGRLAPLPKLTWMECEYRPQLPLQQVQGFPRPLQL